MITKKAILIIVIVLMPAMIPAGFSQSPNSNSNQGDIERIFSDRAKARNTSISFWGLVLDQEDEPVPDAVVRVKIGESIVPGGSEYTVDSRTLDFVTDQNGLFDIKDEFGSSIYIVWIKKKGYDNSELMKSDKSFFYYRRRMEEPFEPNPDKPVILRLRKQRDAVFCMTERYWKLGISNKDIRHVVGYDFIRKMKVADIQKAVFDAKPLVCDLLLDVSYSSSGRWAIKVLPGNGQGGIQISKEKLLEAPREGYLDKIELNPDQRHLVPPSYIYLKSRSPEIYTRIELNYVNSRADFVRLSGSVVTNPYGERNFDAALDLPFHIEKQLRTDVEQAFLKDQRPVKPDLQKLLEDVD